MEGSILMNLMFSGFCVVGNYSEYVNGKIMYYSKLTESLRWL